MTNTQQGDEWRKKKVSRRDGIQFRKKRRESKAEVKAESKTTIKKKKRAIREKRGQQNQGQETEKGICFPGD